MRKRSAPVLGARMAFVEAGRGDPIVFLHGNPTSSFLWRQVIPQVDHLGTCLAPDLIGMGDSQKVGRGPRSYRFVDHRTYIDAFLEVMGIDEGVIVVGHEWGGALALDWANRHREAVRGVAYLETIVTPLTWYDWPESARSIFQALRTEAGDEMVLVKNLIVERLLPAGVIEPLPADVMAEYRRPYPDVGEERRPMLSWPRELPIDGDPEAVADVVGGYSAWLASSSIPKLFINGDPGWMLVGRQREVCRQWPNQTEVTVPGIHYLQEDAGGMIGTALAQWIKSL